MTSSRLVAPRIPSLDGLRAIAILLVIVLHIIQRNLTSIGNLKFGVALVLLASGDGVGIFFVLSGFLITGLLLKEYDATGRINLYNFYLRRTFRILPPLYTYLVFVIIFCAVVGYPLHARTIDGSALFFLNYFPGDGQWFTEHTWSLCIEEQFYLLWPILLIWALTRGGRPASAGIASVLIVAAPILRIVTKVAHAYILDQRVMFLLHTRIDALMCGCLLALLINTPRFESFYAKMARYWWALPIEFMFFSGLMRFAFGNNYRNTVGYTIDSIFVALFIAWTTRNEKSLIGRFLNSRIIVRICVLSYSIYIWQTFFINANNRTCANRMPWAVGLLWIVAELSHWLVERPTLRMRKLIERKIAIGRPA